MTVRTKAMIKDGLLMGTIYAVLLGIVSWHDNPNESVLSKIGWLISDGAFTGLIFGAAFRPTFDAISRRIAPPKEKSNDMGEAS